MRHAALPVLLSGALLLGMSPICLAQPARAQPWAAEPSRAAGRMALNAASQNRFDLAAGAALQADPLVRKLVLWLQLQQRGQGTAAELVAFQAANPDWPMPNSLARRTEEALVLDPDDALALRHYARVPPRTLDGAQRLADALTRAGRGAEASTLLRAAWAEGWGDGASEAAYSARNFALLTEEDRWSRFDRLMMARDIGGATRAANPLSPANRARADARLALAGDRADAEALSAGAADLGLLSERARWLRRRDRDPEAAAAWAQAAPLQKGLAPEAERAIWAERNILARRLLRSGDARAAYAVAAQHGQSGPGEARGEAEFLAGWIALRRLNEPAAAARHFALVGDNSASVITRARAGFWEGRAQAASGNAEKARALLTDAAGYGTAFYGQIAALTLGEDMPRVAARIRAIAPPQPTAETTNLFLDRELAKVVLTLADLGDTRRARTFLLRMEELSPDPQDRVLVARLGTTIGRPDHAVWIARRAGADGVMLLPEGWPTPYPAPEGGLDPAIMNAIARQESNFDTEAVSSANARGLMQLLPATAAGVARKLNLAHQPGWLTTNPNHNLRLGSQYLADQLDRYGGNLALAAAAYNAGPRRADEWLTSIGTPGTGVGEVDMLDWIEMIPFNETRNYVQRVVENTVVYRARGGADTAHPLAPWMTVR